MTLTKILMKGTFAALAIFMAFGTAGAEAKGKKIWRKKGSCYATVLSPICSPVGSNTRNGCEPQYAYCRKIRLSEGGGHGDVGVPTYGPACCNVPNPGQGKTTNPPA